MKLAIGTCWYKGTKDQDFERLIKSFSLFDQDKTFFYVYLDEAPEESKTDYIQFLFDKYCIKNYTLIQGKQNNAVYYAKRKLVFSIKEKLCCIIDSDDEFTTEFADYTKNHNFDFNYCFYSFGANCIGNKSMAYTGNKDRLEAFTSGNHFCVWGKVIQTKALQAAYSLLPKYQYKFIYGEENLVINLIYTLPSKNIKLKMLNYFEGGMSTVRTITSVQTFKQFLSGVYLATVDGGQKVIDYVYTRLPLLDESIYKECLHLFHRYVNKVKEVSNVVQTRMNNGEALPDIEVDLFEKNKIDLLNIFGEENKCNWLPEDN